MNIHEWKMSTKQKNTINIYELTENEKTVIDKIKQIYGEGWRDELKTKWRTGNYKWGFDTDEIATLQHLRNKIGSKRLNTLK